MRPKASQYLSTKPCVSVSLHMLIDVKQWAYKTTIPCLKKLIFPRNQLISIVISIWIYLRLEKIWRGVESVGWAAGGPWGCGLSSPFFSLYTSSLFCSSSWQQPQDQILPLSFCTVTLPLSWKPSYQLTKPGAGSVLGWGHFLLLQSVQPNKGLSHRCIHVFKWCHQDHVSHTASQVMFVSAFFFFFVCGPILFLYNYAHCI